MDFDLDHMSIYSVLFDLKFWYVPYSFLRLLLCFDSKLLFLSLCSARENLNTF